MPVKKPTKKENLLAIDPSIDFKQLLAKVQASGGNPLAVQAELQSFQSKMKAKISPTQASQAQQIAQEHFAERKAQGKDKVPHTEAERQAYMKEILKKMGSPFDKR